ncbi:MAG: monovalent cation/H(+) antiporter subunit G [Steroidobacteraceae bacterium]|nr:monovalent cation/H(+) antiporter subunit G [Steroidobacteraceae bacterium]MDW8260282.1 monovalent cation/H(+) antiporter subunit G [Gammaproteobacteria bacterium]
MSALIEWLSDACLIGGSFFALVGAFGLLRMPDFFTRVHAASVLETLGAGLILLGLVLKAGWTLVAAKLLIVGLLLFFTSPTATHALVRAAWLRGLRPVSIGGAGEAPSKR